MHENNIHQRIANRTNNTKVEEKRGFYEKHILPIYTSNKYTMNNIGIKSSISEILGHTNLHSGTSSVIPTKTDKVEKSTKDIKLIREGQIIEELEVKGNKQQFNPTTKGKKSTSSSSNEIKSSESLKGRNNQAVVVLDVCT